MVRLRLADLRELETIRYSAAVVVLMATKMVCWARVANLSLKR